MYKNFLQVICVLVVSLLVFYYIYISKNHFDTIEEAISNELHGNNYQYLVVSKLYNNNNYTIVKHDETLKYFLIVESNRGWKVLHSDPIGLPLKNANEYQAIKSGDSVFVYGTIKLENHVEVNATRVGKHSLDLFNSEREGFFFYRIIPSDDSIEVQFIS